MPPLRVLHLYKDYYPVLGGIENHIRLLAALQRKRGWDVTVLVTNSSRRLEELNDDGVRVIKAGRIATLASTPISLSFPRWVGRLESDVTHIHSPYPLAEIAHLWWGKGKRTVLTYHSDVVRQKWMLPLYKPFLWQVLRRSHRIIATNEPYVASSPFLREFRGKIDIVPSGIPVERFTRADERRAGAIRSAALARLPATRSVILSVGRLRYYKGLETLISAMATIPATLVLVGSGPMEAPWKALARKLGVEDRVWFVGEVSDEELPCYYHASDLYVSAASHRSEALGVSLIEALASGLPVISTELGTGTSFVNLHGVTGLVIPPRDAGALSEAIQQVLRDKERAQEFGRRGRERAAEEFSAELMADRIEQVYERALGEAPPAGRDGTVSRG